MNTQENTTVPTLSQLWSRFDSIRNRFGSSKDYSKLIDLSRYANPAKGRIDWVNEITSLRQQLLERCRSVADADEFCTEFEIETSTRDGLLELTTTFRNRIGTITKYPRSDNADTLTDFANACNFWLWELEQQKREKEAQNGN